MINFMKYFSYGAIFSFLFIGAFIGTAFYNRVTRGYIFEYSVEFTGGTEMLFQFSQTLKGEEVIRTLEAAGIQGVTCRDFSDKEILIRTKKFESDMQGLATQFKTILEKARPGLQIIIKSADRVSGGIGSELAYRSLFAIVLSLVAMLLYLWFSLHHYAFAVASIVALMHDVIIMLAFIMFFNYEISMSVISAILVILGYSVNDTIVVFARMRENFTKMAHASIGDIINASLTTTLRRTLLTSFATLLVVVALMLFGGDALRAISFALLIGIIFGTYSSIFIASPVMMLVRRDADSE
jgi:preprotein translocase subunit SecF